jgi:hypothetical protein
MANRDPNIPFSLYKGDPMGYKITYGFMPPGVLNTFKVP